MASPMKGTPSRGGPTRQFSRPMMFDPTLAASSPSKKKEWANELGLSDVRGDANSDESDEGEVTNGAKGDYVSRVEHNSVLQLVQKESKLKEEALLSVKAWEEKFAKTERQYQTAQEHNKTQLNILRKTYQQQLEHAQKELHEVKHLAEEYEDKLTVLESHATGDRSRPVPEVTGVKRLTDMIEQLQSENRVLSGRANELAAASEEIAQLKQSVASLEKEKRELQQKQSLLLSAKPTVVAAPAETSKEDAATIASLRKENDSLRKKVEDLEQREIVNARNKGIERDMEAATSRFKAEADKLKADADKLKAELEDAQRVAKKITRERDDLQAKVTQLQTTNAALSAKGESAAAETSTALRSAQDEAKRAQAKVDETLKSLRNVESERDELQSKLRAVTSERDDALSKLKASLSDGDTTKSKLVSVTGERDALSKDLATARSRIADLESVEAKRAKDVEDAKAAVRAAEAAATSAAADAKVAADRAIADAKVRLDAEVKGTRDKMAWVVSMLGKMKSEYNQIRSAHDALKTEAGTMNRTVRDGITVATKSVLKAISEQDKMNKELVLKYRKEMALRKKYHNELVELKGNIRVYCRVRPLLDGEGENVVAFDNDDDGIVKVLSKGTVKTIEVDKVFTPASTQDSVFEEVRALVVSCIDGYNVCIFAYGQTGSGKTYTMEGPDSDPGINTRALQELFTITAERSGDFTYSITVSVIEIYNEQVRDLLGNDVNAKLDIKQSPEGNYVPGLVSYEVSNLNDLRRIFEIGKANRQTATTNMNEHSSRSHALLCVTVEGTNTGTNQRTIGRLNLVDLAGSERVSKSEVTGDRLKEAQNINSSLSALGDVIHALINKQKHVPYRNSKLTYLLQDSLGGDSKTLMVVQVSPADYNSGETMCTLNFASRVRNVELGAASKRVERVESPNPTDAAKLRASGAASPNPSSVDPNKGKKLPQRSMTLGGPGSGSPMKK